MVTPEVSIDTTGDEVKDQRDTARRIVLVPENRAYVIGEADEPIEAVYTACDNCQKYTHGNISLLNTQVHLPSPSFSFNRLPQTRRFHRRIREFL